MGRGFDVDGISFPVTRGTKSVLEGDCLALHVFSVSGSTCTFRFLGPLEVGSSFCFVFFGFGCVLFFRV